MYLQSLACGKKLYDSLFNLVKSSYRFEIPRASHCHHHCILIGGKRIAEYFGYALPTEDCIGCDYFPANIGLIEDLLHKKRRENTTILLRQTPTMKFVSLWIMVGIRTWTIRMEQETIIA